MFSPSDIGLHTRGNCPGMAIGLPTCKKIVGRHGGGIRGAQEGRGTMFFFNLPVCTEGLPAQASCGKSDQLA